MNRRTFLQQTAATAAALVSPSAWPAALKTTAPRDDEILAQTTARIEQHRQGDGLILVRAAAGQPLPGVRVQIEQQRHDFRFGCNAFMVGRYPDTAQDDAYRAHFAALFNFATLGFYWPFYERERGRPIYDYTDQVLDWARRHRIECKGHPLVWDFADPRWLPRDFAEIRTLSNSRVRDIVARYQGRLDIWDVVNEPTHLGRFKTRLGDWAMSMGAVPYVTEHVKIARAANPQATLLVNDYRTDPPFYKILDALRADGKLLFDAIGIQSHMHDGIWPLRRVWEVCDTFSKLGRPIHFTETTIVSGPRKGPGENWGPTTPELEAKQADDVARFYTTLFAHPSVQAITWWDFSDAGAWQGAAAGFLRKDMSPKPVYERLSTLIKRTWWTKAEGLTNARGELPARAFFGMQRVTATLPTGRQLSREVHWQRGEANRVLITA